MNYFEKRNINLNEISNSIINILTHIYKPNNAAVIFDIDDTLIDYKGIPIQQIVNIYLFCLQNNIKPIIITNRVGTPEIIKITLDQLNLIGIEDQTLVYFRKDIFADHWDSKYEARKDVASKG